MTCKIYRFLILLFVAAQPAVMAQPLTVSGDTYLILNGERFKDQKIVFSKAQGDWYATPGDSHGTIQFNTTFDGRDLRLDIEWDGKNEPHIINNEVRHRQREGEFIITLPDKNVYSDGLNSYPSGEDEIKITINKIDDANVSGEISGVVTEDNDKVQVKGVFNLRKNATSKKISNSSYKDCDNVVHDKLVGAEGRSPSDCEAKYDLDVRTAVHDAIAACVEKFKSNGWEIQEETSLEPLTIVARGSEKNIFSTSYSLALQATPANATYADYQKKYADVSQNLKDGKETYPQFASFIREMNAAIKIDMQVWVNNHSAGLGNYKGGATISRLASNIYRIQSPYTQARTGGGEDASSDVTLLLIGSWKQPVIQKLSDGGEQIESTAILNPTASHLQAQNIVIRMECNKAIAEDIIKNIDLQKLQALISH